MPGTLMMQHAESSKYIRERNEGICRRGKLHSQCSSACRTFGIFA